jgi:hypothetical protein
MSSRGLIGITWEGGLCAASTSALAISSTLAWFRSFVGRPSPRALANADVCTSLRGCRATGAWVFKRLTRTISLGYLLYSFRPICNPIYKPVAIPTPPPPVRRNGIDLDAKRSDTVRVRQK